MDRVIRDKLDELGRLGNGGFEMNAGFYFFARFDGGLTEVDGGHRVGGFDFSDDQFRFPLILDDDVVGVGSIRREVP